MVARLFQLRLALFAGAFRGSLGHALRAAVAFGVCLAGAVIFALLPTWMVERGAVRDATDVVFGSLVVGLSVLVPLFHSRANLSPRQFATFPVRPGKVAVSLLVTSVVTRPFLVLLAWLVTLYVSRPGWQAAGWIAPVALFAAAFFVLAGVRLTSGIAQVVAGERFQGGLRFTGVVLGVSMLPLLVYAVANTLQSPEKRMLIDTAEPLSWTPFGAPFAAVAAAANGETQSSALQLVIVCAVAVICTSLWALLAIASFERIERPVDVNSARQGLGWFERFAARPSHVIAARALTYWTRDPRYRLALLALPVAPIAILLAFLIAGADFKFAVALPLPFLMLLLGWFLHNDVAMDSTAIWEHIASGIRGWTDRAGRLAPALVFGVPIAVIGSSLTATFMGEWRVLPALIGLNVGVLLVASGVSSVFSAMMPYPATRPGDSPFVQPQWTGSGSGSAQTISMLVSITVCLPIVWVAVAALVEVTFAGNMLALIGGIGYGSVMLLSGVLIGGKIFDNQGPEILAVTQIFD